MNCSPTIAIALMLLSFSAGMFLLYKSQKEGLSMLFKAAAWFIIIISLGSMACCSIRCVFHGCGSQGNCGGMEQCGPEGSGECGDEHGNFKKCIIITKGGHGGCEMMEEGCCMDKMGCDEEMEECEEGKEACCKEGEKKGCEEMKMKVEKDTVVKKH